MRLGITGATGFIGGHLLRSAVVERGLRPVAFIERGSPRAAIADLDGKFEAVEGDLLDPASVDGFIEGCDAVFHLAGLNRYWARDPGIFDRVNVAGARNVAESALRRGVKRLVHASSCITLGASLEPTPRNEASEYNLRHLEFKYGETKLGGERLMEDFAREKGLPVVIVNPTSAIGERDHGPTPIGKPILDILRGMWPVYVAGGACFIDVHDVVRGMWLALERGRIGEKYLLVGENLTNQEFMSRVAVAAGRRPPRLRVPKAALGVAAYAGEWLADHVTQKHPPLTRGMLGLIGRYLYFDRDKAERELGFQAGHCQPAIERSVEWFRASIS